LTAGAVYVGDATQASPGQHRHAASARMTLAHRENSRLNVIESINQPWKRWLEGATGGYWGMFNRASGAPKFPFSGVVSDHPYWLLQALAGMLLAAIIFASAWWGAGGKPAVLHLWPRIA